MDTVGFKNKWPEMKELIKTEHPHITDAELEYQPGDELKLLERLQMSTGMTRAEIHKLLNLPE